MTPMRPGPRSDVSGSRTSRGQGATTTGKPTWMKVFVAVPVADVAGIIQMP